MGLGELQIDLVVNLSPILNFQFAIFNLQFPQSLSPTLPFAPSPLSFASLCQPIPYSL